MSVFDVVTAARKVGLTGSALTMAVAVSLAENGDSDPRATHRNSDGSTDYGLWQINSIHGYDPAVLLTPDGNAAAMYAISKGGKDWTPWATYPAKAQSQVGKANLAVKAKPIEKNDSYLSDAINEVSGGTVKNVSSLVNVAGSTVKNVSSLVNVAGSIAGHLLDSKWWLRIGQGIAGAALLLIALGLIFRKQVSSTVGAVIPHA